MNLNQLKQVIPALLDDGISIELQSSPGLGKSEFVFQTIDAMTRRDGKQWGIATMFLATQTPPDLIGYQFKSERAFNGFKDNKPVSVTDPSMPLWMFTTDGRPVHTYERGILFLDEYGQGDADVKRASAELLLNRQIGPWKLPDGWSVIAASNRSEDRSGVTKSFDFVINRRLEIQLTPDVKSWEEWAFNEGIDPLYISFAAQNPQIVFDGKVPEKQGPWCTPRSLVKAARIMKSLGGQITPLTGEIMNGIIGGAAAAQLAAWVKLGQEAPKYEDIVADPMKAKMPKKPDLLMLVSYNLAARVTLEEHEPVIKYITREEMPKELSLTFLQTAIRRHNALIHTKAVGAWLDGNPSLFNAFNKS